MGLTIIEADRPALFGQFVYPNDRSIETDVGQQVKIFGVSLKILQHLTVGWIVGVIIRHRKICKLRHFFGTDDVRCFTNASMGGPGGINPVASDPAVAFKANDLCHTGLHEVFDAGQARTAGTNYANTFGELIHGLFVFVSPVIRQILNAVIELSHPNA